MGLCFSRRFSGKPEKGHVAYQEIGGLDRYYVTRDYYQIRGCFTDEPKYSNDVEKQKIERISFKSKLLFVNLILICLCILYIQFYSVLRKTKKNSKISKVLTRDFVGKERKRANLVEESREVEPNVGTIQDTSKMTERDPSRGHERILESDESCDNELDEFLFDLYEVAQLNRGQAELTEVGNLVTALVRFLLKKVEEENPTMKCQDLVLTGSASDGTKVLQPDEFDFLAVYVDDLKGEIFDVSVECMENHGFAHVIMNNEEKPTVLKEILAEGRVPSVGTVGGVCSFREQFRVLFHNAVIRCRGLKLKLNSSCGYLELEGFSISINGPECTVEASWEPKDNVSGGKINVSIDVCPAFRSHHAKIVKSCGKMSACEKKALKCSKSLYLIPKPVSGCQYCFKLVFAEQDRELVTGLSNVHKQCLIILKYIARMINCKHFCTRVSINSFIVKTILLHHSFNCTGDSSLAECFIDVLEKYRNALRSERPDFPCVFNKNRNAFRTLINSDAHVASLSAAIVERILELCQEMKNGSSSGYNFNRRFRQLQDRISNTQI